MPKKAPSKRCLMHEAKLQDVGKKIDELTTMMSAHVEESKTVRDEIKTDSNDITWHKRWLWALTCCIVTLFTWLTGKSFWGN